MNKPGKLYLIPVPISDDKIADQLPSHNSSLVKGLKYFIAEDAKTARRFLKSFGYEDLQQAEIGLLNEHTKNETTSELIKPLLNGYDTGLMSDAGCPGIADPGADVVRKAHEKNIEVIPLVGPSSILLAIMSSGFNGQNFSFAGYLPIDKNQRSKRIKDLEQLALKQKQAQFFIETPYRNEQLFETLLSVLSPSTMLFIGRSFLSPQQYVKSATIAEWRKKGKPRLNKIPVVFGIFS